MKPNLALTALALLLSATVGGAAAPAAWKKVANERQLTRDPATGAEIIYLTTAQYQNGIFYPHCQGWSADERFVWFTSTRPRPGGGGAAGEAQLMAADTRTGDLYHLATLAGPAEGRPRSREIPHHADYCPATNTIIFTDLFDKNLHSLDLASGAVTHLWKMEDGHFGHPTSISRDGRRVAFWAMFNGPGPNAFFKGYTNATFYLDLDETGTEPAGVPRMINAYPTRIIPDAKETLRDAINITHAQLNPADRDLLAYCHGSYAYPDGSGHLSRIWTVRVDGSQDHNLLPTPAGRTHTHELWSHDGQWMYYIDTVDDLCRVSTDGSKIEVVSGGQRLRSLHLSVSDDMTRIAYDVRVNANKDAEGNAAGEIWWFDVAAQTPRKLASAPWNERFHTHGHPQISPSGSSIIFNVADGKGSRVALVRLPPQKQ